MKKISDLTALNITSFFKSQQYLLPVMLLFYNQNGLGVADYLFFQGIVCFAELLLGLPGGWLADRFQKKYVLILSYMMLFARYFLWLFFGGYWIVLAGELCYAAYKSLFQCSAEGYIYQYLCDNAKEQKNLAQYGRFNFATSVGSALSALLGAVIFKEVGIKIVLIIQLLIIAVSIALLLTLKPVKKAAVYTQKSKKRYGEFVRLAVYLKNSDLKFYILTGSVFSALTMLMVNAFQPLMQFGAVPVMMFGVVYFFNHITRALAGLGAAKIITRAGLKRLAYTVYIMMLLSCVVMFGVIKYDIALAVLPLLFFICLGIALQLCLNVAITSYLQEHSSIENRSMMSSVHNTSIRLMSSLILFIGTSAVKMYGLLYQPVVGLLFVVFLFLPIRRLQGKKL